MPRSSRRYSIQIEVDTSNPKPHAITKQINTRWSELILKKKWAEKRGKEQNIDYGHTEINAVNVIGEMCMWVKRRAKMDE
jgi:hypothetical protein